MIIWIRLFMHWRNLLEKQYVKPPKMLLNSMILKKFNFRKLLATLAFSLKFLFQVQNICQKPVTVDMKLKQKVIFTLLFYLFWSETGVSEQHEKIRSDIIELSRLFDLFTCHSLGIVFIIMCEQYCNFRGH